MTLLSIIFKMNIFSYFKESGKITDVLIQSIGWMIISMVAAYQSFCLHFNSEAFTTETRDDYCEKFLLPIVLFLIAFILDFFFSIKDLPIGEKRGTLLKLFTFLICTMFIFLFIITVLPWLGAKIIAFILLWFNISLIKGLTILIPGKEENVELTAPINDIK